MRSQINKYKYIYKPVTTHYLFSVILTSVLPAAEFGIPKKLARLIKMCLTETYSRVQVGKNLSDVSY